MTLSSRHTVWRWPLCRYYLFITFSSVNDIFFISTSLLFYFAVFISSSYSEGNNSAVSQLSHDERNIVENDLKWDGFCLGTFERTNLNSRRDCNLLRKIPSVINNRNSIVEKQKDLFSWWTDFFKGKYIDISFAWMSFMLRCVLVDYMNEDLKSRSSHSQK